MKPTQKCTLKTKKLKSTWPTATKAFHVRSYWIPAQRLISRAKLQRWLERPPWKRSKVKPRPLTPIRQRGCRARGKRRKNHLSGFSQLRSPRCHSDPPPRACGLEEDGLHQDKHCHRKPLLQDREVLPFRTELTGWASRIVGDILLFINWRQKAVPSPLCNIPRQNR